MASGKQRLKDTVKSACVLLVYFFAYLLFLAIGGMIFVAIEKDKDLQLKKQYRQHFMDVLNKYNMSMNNSMIRDVVSAAVEAHDMGGLDPDNYWASPSSSWNIASGLFFCATIVTTIGYGNIAPLTDLGRGFCIFYILLGIPITGLLLAKFGSMMTSAIKQADDKIEFTLRPVIRCIFSEGNVKKYVRLAQLIITTILFLVFFWLIPAACMMATEGWDYMTAVYFCLISLTTVGLGDVVPGVSSAGHLSGRKKGSLNNFHAMAFQISCVFYLVLGLSALTIILNLMRSLGKIIAESTMNAANNIVGDAIGTSRLTSMRRKITSSLGTSENSEEHPGEDNVDGSDSLPSDNEPAVIAEEEEEEQEDGSELYVCSSCHETYKQNKLTGNETARSYVSIGSRDHVINKSAVQIAFDTSTQPKTKDSATRASLSVVPTIFLQSDDGNRTKLLQPQYTVSPHDGARHSMSPILRSPTVITNRHKSELCDEEVIEQTGRDGNSFRVPEPKATNSAHNQMHTTVPCGHTNCDAQTCSTTKNKVWFVSERRKSLTLYEVDLDNGGYTEDRTNKSTVGISAIGSPTAARDGCSVAPMTSGDSINRPYCLPRRLTPLRKRIAKDSFSELSDEEWSAT